jgi:hypothetical protein
MSQVTLQGNASGTGIFTLAAPNSNTNRTLNLPDAAGDVVLTTATQTLTNKSISGAQINSGTVAAARLGSGTPGTGNFLRGDGSWQTVPASAPSTTDVLNAYAGAAYGGVGTYTVALSGATLTGGNSIAAGSTEAGSGLRAVVSSTSNNAIGNLTALQTAATATLGLAGTWRLMMLLRRNDAQAAAHLGGLYLRIS